MNGAVLLAVLLGGPVAMCGCNGLLGIEPPADNSASDAAGLDAFVATTDATDSVPPRNDPPDAMADASMPDVSGGAETDRSRPVCRLSSGMFSDPNTGITWTTVWFCGNDFGAPIYEQASGATLVATMSTVESWFACYRHGEPHKGGNDVWYYTQGDHIEPGWESRRAWGYMPAYSVYTSVDPIVGMVQCTDNP